MDPGSGTTESMIMIREEDFNAGRRFLRILVDCAFGQSCKIMRMKYTSAPLYDCG